MIKVNFNAYDSYVTDSVTQWDLNRVLTVTGLNLSVVPEVHFSNASVDRAIVRQATMINHVVTVTIPNSLLQDPLPIKADIGIYESDTFKVIETILIPVKPKKRPLDYQIQDSDEEVYSFNRLENMIEQIDERWSSFTQSTVDEAVNEWLTDHPEATTTIQDGSLSESKFTDDLKHLTIKDYVTPQMFGAVGDGATNDTAAINSAVSHCITNKCRLVFPKGRYRINSTVDFRYIDIEVQGTIVIGHSGVGIIVGDKSISAEKRTISINSVEHSSYSNGDISVRIVGLMNGDVNIGNANYVQLYADGDSDYSAIAYSNFHIGKCDYLQITDKAGASKIGWINENSFYNCRVLTKFSIEGNTYTHNNNVFYKPCFENAQAVLSNCTRNKFYNVRNEGTFSLTLDENTSANLIDYNYFYTFPYVINSTLGITDNGLNNIITNSSFNDLHSVLVYSLNAHTVNKNLYEIGNAKNYLSVSDDVVTIAKEWATIVDNAIIPVKGISFIRIMADLGAFRFSFTPLDGEKNVMLNNPLTQDGNSSGANSSGVYSIDIDSWGANIAITDPDVEYIRLNIGTGSSASSFSFKTLSVMAYYHPYDFRRATILADCLKTAIPTA